VAVGVERQIRPALLLELGEAFFVLNATSISNVTRGKRRERVEDNAVPYIMSVKRVDIRTNPYVYRKIDHGSLYSVVYHKLYLSDCSFFKRSSEERGHV